MNLYRYTDKFSWNYEQASNEPLSRLEQLYAVVMQCSNILETKTEQKVSYITVGSEELKEFLNSKIKIRLFVENDLPINVVKIVMQNLKYGTLEIVNPPSNFR